MSQNFTDRRQCDRESKATHFRLRLSCTMHSTSSHRQLPQGAPSTTSQRTLRARHDTQARAARRLVTLPSVVETDALFFGDCAVPVTDRGAGGGVPELGGAEDEDRGEGVSPASDIVWRGCRPRPKMDDSGMIRTFSRCRLTSSALVDR
jgi:hypothetical protein